MFVTKRFIIFAILLLLSFILPGCEKAGEKELGSKDLVRINRVSISLEEFRHMSELQPLERKMRLLTEKGLRDFLDNYVITREVLYQEAQEKGLDKNKEIMAKVEDFKRAMLIDALLEERLQGRDEVSEKEVRQYYKDNPDRFTEAREIKIRHIVVSSEPALMEVMTRLSKGESFAKLASSYNIEPFREGEGDLGYIRRGQLSPYFAQFEEAAFTLRKPGEISEVVKTPYGYHIIRLEEKRGTVLRPFDQVKEKIRLFLHAKKRQDAYLQYVNEAKKRAKIIVNEKLWAEEEAKERRAEIEKK
jgi:peptidyl-prolyl cis-trans isomerase C